MFDLPIEEGLEIEKIFNENGFETTFKYVDEERCKLYVHVEYTRYNEYLPLTFTYHKDKQLRTYAYGLKIKF